MLSDNHSNDWADLQGIGTVSRNAALIDELWNPFASAYFDDGWDSPGIAAFRLKIVSGRYWSSPSGRIDSLVSLVSAAIGKSSSGGDHRRRCGLGTAAHVCHLWLDESWRGTARGGGSRPSLAVAGRRWR